MKDIQYNWGLLAASNFVMAASNDVMAEFNDMLAAPNGKNTNVL